ncbi:helix-turn-helix transcriptional regulator [Paenibacillus sp. FSL K6-2393]|uniref:helix-turn-helix transcriptional regulator n=1 Tax=Paenibacillus sp. FSL K6-2393 TaxID=2921475 RepID=UPI0030F56F50
MKEKIIRLMKIIIAIQANPGITANMLAEKCEVNPRTIYRDLELLTTVVPILNEGKNTGYRFEGNFNIFPLDFNEQEALAFLLLPSFINKDKLPSGFESAYDKVISAHFKEKRQQNNIIHNIADIIQMGIPSYQKESNNFLENIIQATIELRSIETVYHTQYRDETTARRIDPYFLVPRDQKFYLIGYCHMKKEIRTFRISRFLKVDITDQTFEKNHFSIRQYFKNTWSIERGDKNTRFKVRFKEDVARYVKEKELFVHPRITDESDGSIIFEVTVNNDKEFIKWLLRYGPDAEVLEPQAVREQLKEKLNKWNQIY